MLARDAALAAVHQFLTRLDVDGRGALVVRGQPGAGHTRFLAEVATIARARGLGVAHLTAGEPGPAAVPEGDLLLLADVGAGPQVASAVARLTADRRVLGLVYTGDADDVGLPVLGTAELAPWSAATLRMWLRANLPGEPSRALVNLLLARSRGLPGRAARELGRLIGRSLLMSTGSGGWTVDPATVLDRPSRRARLPVPMTPLLGREAERADVGGLLDGHQLVTLAGPGGIGKTRLALAVAAALADDLYDGAVFVPLADATDVAGVVAAIGAALRVEPVPDQSLFDGVVEQLADASLLLVLDNLEQVVSAAGTLGDLLAAAPGVRALATSRERLSLPNEQVYAVPPLGLPRLDALPRDAAAIAHALAEFPALALFEQRAQASDPDFTISPDTLPAVAALCHRLDGLPLAIELAAARVDLRSPQDLLAELAGHLDGLGGGPRDLPARQQTLRGAIDWSVRLLAADDEDLFVRLAVFVGGCTVGSALAVSGGTELADMADRLRRLAEKSLLVADADADGSVRYRALQTIRAYALARLEQHPAAGAVRRGHAEHYAAFADRLGDELTGPDQVEWRARVALEYPNLRAALAAAMGERDPALGTRLCLGLWRYWRTSTHLGEGRQWLAQLLSGPAAGGGAETVSTLYAAAMLAAEQDDHEASRRLAEEGLARATALGDRAGMAQAHNALGLAATGASDYPLATLHYRESLAIWSALDEPTGTAIALGNLAGVALRSGDLDAADRFVSESLALERAAANASGMLLDLECLADIRLARRDVAGARLILAESLSLSRQLDDVFGEAKAIHQSGLAELYDGDRAAALRLLVDAVERRQAHGDLQDVAASLDAVAEVVAPDQPALAAQFLGAADELRGRYRRPAALAFETRREETVLAVRAALGETNFDISTRAGATTTVDTLVARVRGAGAEVQVGPGGQQG